MIESETAASSLAQHAQLFDAGAHVVAAAFVDGAPTLALADGVVLIGDPQQQKRVVVYPDAAILTAIGDGKTLLTGGDDGRVVAVRADGGIEDIADEKGRWIDALALRGKACAWSAGKQVRARDESGAIKSWSAPTTARGLAFQPKGFRLADAAEILVRLPGDGAVSALAWGAMGSQLLFGLESGAAGLLSLPA